jgi:hypothetical protein
VARLRQLGSANLVVSGRGGDRRCGKRTINTPSRHWEGLSGNTGRQSKANSAAGCLWTGDWFWYSTREAQKRTTNEFAGKFEIWNDYGTYNASLGSVVLLLRAIVEAPTTLPDVLKIGDTVTDTRICWPSFVIRVVS